MEQDSEWLRFVVLHHTGVDPEHYDVLVETSPGSMLAAWRAPTWPLVGETTLTQLPDHRREYLTYEGPVSSNRGQVKRVAEGEVRIERSTDDRGRECWILYLRPQQGPPVSRLILTDCVSRWTGTTM